MQKDYDTFWSELSHAYPKSKGELRLPIATSLQTIDEIDLGKTLTELKELLQIFLDKFANPETARINAVQADEEWITPCINEDFTGIVRFDCVLNQDNEVKILELNTDYPDGLLMHDRTYSITSDKTCTLHEDLYLKYFKDKSHKIHIAYPEDAFFLDAYYLEKEVLERNGYTVTIGDILEAKATKTIRRCIEVSKMHNAHIPHLLQESDHQLNSLSLRTLGYKHLLSKIDHPLIPKTIPCTKETVAELNTQKDKWLLKPSQGCEGNGINFGKDMTGEDWLEKTTQLCEQNYIAQEYVDTKKRDITFYDNGGTITKNLYFDFCPHFFISNGVITGAGHTLMRFSENKVMNVTQGGGIGYHVVP